jgi:cellulose synthase/poly-beta-1,6-N-acetylglucosamine synthase-like glycosyltransferase
MTFVYYALVVYFVLYVIYTIVNGLFARRIIKKQYDPDEVFDPIKYNQDPVRIIVVNDGSTDDTMEVLKNEFNLVKVTKEFSQDLPSQPVRAYYRNYSNVNITVIDKENGGKADSFNAALNVANSDYIVTVDADTVLIKTALMQLMKPVLTNKQIVAVGAQVCVGNQTALDKNGNIKTFELTSDYFSGVQSLEYMKTFLLYRTGHNVAGATLLISGACGLFSKRVLKEVGGFDINSVCEDIEITMRIQEYIRLDSIDDDLQIDFVANPVAWTEAPSTFSSLAKQRNRWFRGSAQTLWKYKNALFNPRLGAMGFYTLPAYWLFGYLVPFVQSILLVILLFTQPPLMALLWGITAACIINLLTISIVKYTNNPVQSTKSKARLFWYGIVEVMFMQFFLTGVHLYAALQALMGKRQWDKFDRVGFKLSEEN